MQGICLDGSLVLPRGLGSANLAELLDFCSRVRDTPQHVVIDASSLCFIEPIGMAILRSLLEDQLESKRVTINFLSRDLTSYLARMDLFKDLDVEGVDLGGVGNRYDRSSTLVEITKVSDHSQAEEIASRLAAALTGNLTRSAPDAPADSITGRNEFDSYRWPLEYALKELLENSLTHARREGRGSAAVWVTCQYFPKQDMVRMAIVDNGCGFLATLRPHPELIEKTHCAAIEAALRPRISCNRGAMAMILGSENQGIGLTATAGIAKIAGGGIMVVSGDAIHDTLKQQNIVLPEEAWSGVAIGFSCKRQKLPSVSINDVLPLDSPSGDGLDDVDFLQFR